MKLEVVIDGFTGQRFDLSTMVEPDGIYVLIRGNKLRAQFHKDDANLKGEYYICDIPVEGVYPIFANITGYLPFESAVKIASTRPMRTPDQPGAVAQEVPIPDPMQLANFRIFPKANGDRNLNINVRKSLAPLEGALVDLEPLTTVGHFAFDGEFANTLGSRLTPTRKTSDAQGLATFATSELAYGARYRLTVTPKASSNAGTFTQDFTLGFNGGGAGDADNWELNVDVSSTAQALAVVGCTASPQSWSDSGTISMVFNRPVAFARGNDQRDHWDAAISGGAAVLVANSASPNNASERVNVSLSSDGKILTLALKSTAFSTAVKTPNYSLLKSDSQNADVDLVVTYTISGIMLDLIDESSAGKNAIALSTVTGASTCKSTRFFQEY